MVLETGLKLRTKLESAKTLTAKTGAEETYEAGEMIKFGDTIGVVVEDVAENSDFVLIYEAEKIVAPKATGTGISFAPGDNVYYDASAKKVTNASTNNTLCGKALGDAGDNTTEALIDLMVLA
jgi:predicted RecA/RadA family phage recombinase